MKARSLMPSVTVRVGLEDAPLYLTPRGVAFHPDKAIINFVRRERGDWILSTSARAVTLEGYVEGGVRRAFFSPETVAGDPLLRILVDEFRPDTDTGPARIEVTL